MLYQVQLKFDAGSIRNKIYGDGQDIEEMLQIPLDILGFVY